MAVVENGSGQVNISGADSPLERLSTLVREEAAALPSAQDAALMVKLAAKVSVRVTAVPTVVAEIGATGVG